MVERPTHKSINKYAQFDNAMQLKIGEINNRKKAILFLKLVEEKQ